ncbi:MAG: hypothetical protein ACR2M8_03075 [Pyrinomonadaceae bacterium]|nr:hypothetical protein [Acidobacteriota bacterium]
MIFDTGIAIKYRQSIDDAFSTILDKGNNFHRFLAGLILESKMLVRVMPVRKINASGLTGLINAGETNDKIASERLSLREALGEVYIAIAEETIDTGGQRGCEGTFIHEGRHAYDFAQTIESFSNADVNPLSIFDPTLYELELEAHKTAGDYMLQVAMEEYLDEGLQLMILGRGEDGACFVDDEGIHCRLRDNYGLTLDGNQGKFASKLLGLEQR